VTLGFPKKKKREADAILVAKKKIENVYTKDPAFVCEKEFLWGIGKKRF